MSAGSLSASGSVREAALIITPQQPEQEFA